MSIALNAFSLMLSGVVVKLVSTLTHFISRRLLGPDAMGVWSLVTIALGYLSAFKTGYVAGSEREIPYWRGRGDEGMAGRIRRQMFSTTIIESAVVSVLFLLFLYIRGKQYRPDLNAGFLLGALFLVAIRLEVCFQICARTLQNFVLLGKLQTVFVVVDFLLVVPLIAFFGLYGQYAAFVLGLLARLLIWFLWVKLARPFDLKWYFRWDEMMPVVKVGLPLVALGLTWQFFTSVDSIAVAKGLGVAAVGYYSLGTTVYRFLTEIYNNLSVVVFPRLMQRYGQTEDVSALRADILRYLKSLCLFAIPALLPCAYFGLPFLVLAFLQNFIPAIPAAKALILGAAFLSLSHIPSQVFVIKKIILRLALLQVFFGGAVWLLCRAAAPRGLVAVAGVTAACYAVYFTGMALWAFRLMAQWRETVRNVGFLFLSMAYTLAVLCGVDLLISFFILPQSLSGHFGRSAGGALLSWLLLLPLFWRAHTDLDVFAHMGRLARGRWGRKTVIPVDGMVNP